MLLNPNAHAAQSPVDDLDPQETAEWMESLEGVVRTGGPRRAQFLLQQLIAQAASLGAKAMPGGVTTPYVNTIAVEREPAYPGNRELERKIKSAVL